MMMSQFGPMHLSRFFATLMYFLQFTQHADNTCPIWVLRIIVSDRKYWCPLNDLAAQTLFQTFICWSMGFHRAQFWVHCASSYTHISILWSEISFAGT